MIEYTRRTVLGGIAGGTLLLAGCTGNDPSSSGFTRTDVEGRELIVEFDEELEPERISVVDPDGESFAETEVSPGATRVTFDVEVPYVPGEYDVLAIDGDDVIAETSQEIRPELEIVDVGVGANRMDEMPEGLGSRRETEAIIIVRNAGTGPESLARLQFVGDVPNPTDPDEDGIGITDPDSLGKARDPIPLDASQEKTLYSSTLPFFFEGDGVNCRPETQSGEMVVRLEGQIVEEEARYQIEYTASNEYDDCDISLQEIS